MRKGEMVGEPREDLEPQAEPRASDPVDESHDSVAQDSLTASRDEQRLVEVRRRVEELPADGSIRMVFQPIVDLATTKVIGYEALARFPGDSSVSPRTWFAEAAEVGLLLEIEMTAIRAALAQLEHLPAGSIHLCQRVSGDGRVRGAPGRPRWP